MNAFMLICFILSAYAQAPGNPQPGQPGQPGQPNPQQPAPGQPNPQQPAPGQPNPQQPAPGQPNPQQPAPGQPNPQQPTPTQPNPQQPAPGQPPNPGQIPTVQPTQGPVVDPKTVPGTPEYRAVSCNNGLQKLIDDYTACLSLFPVKANSPEEADDKVFPFVKCICDSEWKGSSVSQLTTSVPQCPAIKNVSKGQQAAVAADCSGPLSATQVRRVIENFSLVSYITSVNKKYVPLAGLPPGILSTASPMPFGLFILMILMQF